MQIFSKKLLNCVQSGMPSGTIIFEKTTSGSETVTIPEKGRYNIIAVGAGGGSALQAVFSGTAYVQVVAGGSGGYIEADFILDAGSYTATVGAYGTCNFSNSNPLVTGSAGGASSFGSLLTANGGSGAYIKFAAPPVMTGGAGGGSSYSSSGLVSGTLKQITGKTGATDRVYSTSQGAAERRTVAKTTSVYNGYGTGCGGTAYASRSTTSHEFYYGTNGYIKVTYVGKS